MAAYNGAKFIDIQLTSILSQLDQNDEVVVVDDCSTDDTVKRIRNMHDGRIRLIEHAVNQGVVATFEDAIRAAEGEILFLSDDDDVWAPNKVTKYLATFQENPEVQIVTSRIQLIDDQGRPLTNHRITRDGEFFAGFWRNVYKNHYQGSAMAIRASLRDSILPFPTHPSVLHDVWIGTRNALIGGKVAFIEEKLLFYRRHTGNFTRPLSRWKQLSGRAALLWAHFLHTFRLFSLAKTKKP